MPFNWRLILTQSPIFAESIHLFPQQFIAFLNIHLKIIQIKFGIHRERFKITSKFRINLFES